jgi:hypothetical protein
MSIFRIWHLLVLVVAAALLCVAARFDEWQGYCTPITPALAWCYAFGGLGLFGARARGRRASTGLLLGLFLGPIGVLFAWSNPVPDGWPESTRSRGEDRHDQRACP